MQWPSPLTPAVLLRRYKRFLADVRLECGTELTVHCPNTGAMTGCDTPGSRVWLSYSDNLKRKYAYTWQLVEVDGNKVCIHSALANKLVAEALDEQVITELAGFSGYQTEQRLPDGSRIDFVLETASGPCNVEVKSVTLLSEGGGGRFPDAVSTRARRHIRGLREHVAAGGQAVLLFAVLHEGINAVAAAADIDPAYARELAEAQRDGVQLLAYRAQIDEQGMRLQSSLPVTA